MICHWLWQLTWVFSPFSLYPHLFARAYINFRNQEDIVLFRDRFDGYVFIDNRGMKGIHAQLNTESWRFAQAWIEASHLAICLLKQVRSIQLWWSLHLSKRLPRKEARRRMQNVEQLWKVKIFTAIKLIFDVCVREWMYLPLLLKTVISNPASWINACGCLRSIYLR